MEYMTALEREIVTEGLVSDIAGKAMNLFKIIRDAIQKAIRFLVGLIDKLKNKNKANGNSNMDPTPNNMRGANSEVMTNQVITNSVTEDLYDCGNELNRVIDDIQFCIQLLIKRPTPDHKVGKSYSDRWAGDNELIIDRMAKVAEVLDKLDGIENKTVTLEMGEKLKTRLEALNSQYDKYGRIYQMFIKKNPHVEAYMTTTMLSFNTISNMAIRATNMVTTLSTDK